METKSEVAKLVRETESRLRELLAEAAKKGEYADLPLLTTVARSIGELAARVENGAPVAPAAARLPRPPVAEVKKAAEKRRAKKARKRSRRKAGYPKFFKQGENLIKIGYSRKKGEYSHRTPKDAVLLNVEAIARAGSGGRLFTAEEFMPVTDPKGKVEALGYQSYIVLAWLRHEGLVVAEGRQGYRLGVEDGMSGAVEEKWKGLEER